jgi:hypothetical protein
MRTGKIDFTTDVSVTAKNYYQFPRGRTSEQPANAGGGEVRFNNNSSRYEAYINGHWVNLITTKDLTPEGYTPDTTDTSSNLTRGVISEILKRLNETRTGSVVLGVGKYPTIGYSYGVGQPTIQPSWITVENPSSDNITIGLYDAESNFIVGNIPNAGSNSVQNGWFEARFIIDIAALVGFDQSNRGNYKYDAFSCLFEIMDGMNSGNKYWHNSTTMLPITTDTASQDYGKFRLTMRLQSFFNSNDYTQIGVRWMVMLYKFRNFDQF